MNQEQLENKLAARPAPRVTPSMVEAAIVKAEYTLLQDNRTTICLLTLDNGFTVRGESACLSAANYDRELGEHYAREDAVRKVWPLLAFRLADQIARNR